MLQMFNENDVILLPGQQSEDFLQEAIPLEDQVELSESLEPVLVEETQPQEAEEIAEEVKKTPLFARQFSLIVGGVAICASALPIIMGMGEISRISNASECQKAQQIRTNQSSIEALQARFRALGVEPPSISIETMSLSACGPGE
jgi:hypothetical protein